MKMMILQPILLHFILFVTISWAIPCNKNHTVAMDETCKSIISDAQITEQDFFKWNPSLNDDCATLHAGQTVCLEQSSSPGEKTNLPNTSSNNITVTDTDNNNTTDTSLPKPSKTKKKHHEPTPTYLPGLTVAVDDTDSFCLLLPRLPGGKKDEQDGEIDTDAIANSEKDAVVFCTKEELTPGAKLMPEGFITSSLYQFNTTADFVQVTGKIDREKYSLSENDGGGQYDNHGAGSPPLSMCLGYRYYVSLIEPDIQGFCIRCCKSYEDCNASRSAYGCKRVIPTLSFSV